MGWGFLLPIGVEALRWGVSLLGRDKRLPARAVEEAAGEVRADVVPRRWVIGRSRVPGVLVRHVDLIDPRVAKAYHDTASVDDQAEAELRRRRADRRMALWDYNAWVLAEGRANVEDVWLQGVRMGGARNRGAAALADGQLVPPVNPDDEADWEPTEPYWVPQIQLPASLRGGVGVVGRRAQRRYPFDAGDPDDEPQPYWVPSVGFWESVGLPRADITADSRNTSLALRKLREVYTAWSSTRGERLDIASAEGLSVTWILGRFLQTNVLLSGRPWPADLRPEFLCRSDGDVVHPSYGPLLDGNPAKAVYWVLTERMGVPDSAIDKESLEHSMAICDEDVVVLSVSDAPTAASVERAAGFVADIECRAGVGSSACADAFSLLERTSPADAASAVDALARLQSRLDLVGKRVKDSEAAGYQAVDAWYAGLTADAKARLYMAWRVKQVVEQATGRPWTETTGTRRAEILAQWRKRFTGDASDSDGIRKRYAAGGSVTSDMDWRAVLAELGRTMGGRVVEWGGTWYTWAGTHTFRPLVTITDEDVVDGHVTQVLEPPLAEQPTEVRCEIAQDSRGEFERRVMAPVHRDDVNLGDIHADDRPAVSRVNELGFTLTEWNAFTEARRRTELRKVARPLDLGVLPFVTEPLQAAELQRIALYQSRAATRTLRLRVRPGRAFRFYGVPHGAPVAVLLKSEAIAGAVVGERVDGLRCVVVQPPAIQPNGSVEFTLRQQDEDSFGERHGLVYDYNDQPDLVLVGGAYTPTQDLECSFEDIERNPGVAITAADRWQASVSGGSGRVTVSLEHQVGDPRFLAIDSQTRLITGTVPEGERIGGSYLVTVVARDEARRKASCTARLWVGEEVGQPIVAFSPPYPAGVVGTTASFRAYMVFPDNLGRQWDNVKDRPWTFRFTRSESWMSMASNGSASAVVASSQSLGSYDVTVEATASDGRTVTGSTRFRVEDETLAVRCRRVEVQQGVPVDVDVFTSITGATGAVTAAELLRPVPGTSVPVSHIPIGLTLSSSGRLSGTVARDDRTLGTYSVGVRFTDSDTPVGERADCSFDIVVSRPSGGSCAFEHSRWSIPVSGVRSNEVLPSGFTGKVSSVVLTGGACYLSVREDTARGRWFIDAADGSSGCPREVGESSFSVLATDEYGGTARCSGRLIVESNVDPLALVCTGAVADLGGSWADAGGGLSASGGVGPYRYSVTEAARMLADMGCSVDAGTGAFSGTAPSVEQTREYTGVVTDSRGVSASCRFNLVAKDSRPAGYCRDLTVDAVPGGTVSVLTTCDRNSASSLSRVSDSGPAWSGKAWTIGRSRFQPATGFTATQLSFTATVPSSQAAGAVTFELVMRDTAGATERVRVIVNVKVARPLIPVSGFSIKVKRNQGYVGTLVVAGGDTSVDPTFDTFLAKPAWMSISSAGQVSFLGQDQPACATDVGDAVCFSGRVGMTVTRGTSTALMYLTWEVETGGGGGGGGGTDDEDEPDPGDTLA